MWKTTEMKKKWNQKVISHLANISFSSCSDTNCPKFATNNVEHEALAEIGWLGAWEAPVEPTGLANAVMMKIVWGRVVERGAGREWGVKAGEQYNHKWVMRIREVK